MIRSHIQLKQNTYRDQYLY